MAAPQLVRHASIDYLPLLRNTRTESAVSDWFHHLCHGKVIRYNVPGIHAVNFVLTHALDGGGMESLRVDAPGAGFAQMLLDFPVSVPAVLAARHSLAP